MTRYIHVSMVYALLLAIACAPLFAAESAPRKKLQIGVLVSLTGLWSTLGVNTQAALQIGADEINVRSEAAHRGYRVELLVRDTQLQPELALEALKELDQRGVKVVIGPQSSAEVALLKPYADAHDILLISQSSTASALAIAGDNVYRFCPDDTLEAEAIVALMWQDGIRTIVPFWRGDAGNDGLHDSVRLAFLAHGGVVSTGYRYGSATTDFTAAVAEVSAQVAQARQTADPSAVAVYLAAFDKMVDIFQKATPDAVLNATNWYGSDGAVNSAPLLGDPVASAFAAAHRYPNPIFGLDPAKAIAWQPLAARIQAITDVAPDAFALAAYDALFVAYHALEESRGGKDFSVLKSALVATANSYTGATGPTTLNLAGDRIAADFDFWAIREVNGTLSWVVVGRYIDGTLY